MLTLVVFVVSKTAMASCGAELRTNSTKGNDVVLQIRHPTKRARIAGIAVEKPLIYFAAFEAVRSGSFVLLDFDLSSYRRKRIGVLALTSCS